MYTTTANRDKGPRVNDMITSDTIQLIDHEGNNQGNMSPERAINMAYDLGLDLVEISPNAEPPVCKIMDHGKYKYEAQKKAAEARKKQKTIDVKEIKFRPNIDTHDYQVKLRSLIRFLDAGDKVKVTLRFRGREMARQEFGRNLLERISGDTEEVGKVESMPKMEGRQMTMIIAPVS